jgi:MbtH protein
MIESSSGRRVVSLGGGIVTGGLVGLGPTVAEWMAEHDARHLALVGRRPASDTAGQVIAALGQQGVTVAEAAADVIDVRQVRETVEATEPPEGELSVFVNDELQYPPLPTFARVPPGWTVILADKPWDECMAYIEETWTDMRPRSLVDIMSRQG